MSRSFVKAALGSALVMFSLGVTLSGCGSGGGSGGGPAQNPGALAATPSFGVPLSNPAAPSPPNPANFVPVHVNQTISLRFNGLADDSALGGLYAATVGGPPVVFNGIGGDGSIVPYFAYVDQTTARSSVQLRQNMAGGNQLGSYIVGRNRDDAHEIVLDPAVSASNPFGLTPSGGFAPSTPYVVIIPAGNGLRLGGVPANPLGPSVFSLPINAPLFADDPQVSFFFQVDAFTVANPTPPTVVSITTVSGATGTLANPVPSGDPFIITFSNCVRLSTLNLTSTVIVRNLNVSNSSYPTGILVPGNLIPTNAAACTAAGSSDIGSDTYQFVPTPANYGPGFGNPIQGYDLEVRIGNFGVPATTTSPITGMPSGIAGNTAPLANSLAQTFRTIPCTMCQTSASVAESFVNTTKLDTSAPGTNNLLAPFGVGRWNSTSNPGRLSGRLLNGSPFGNTTASLGAGRFQIAVMPTPLCPCAASAFPGLFSPFDSTAANSGGSCGTGGCNLPLSTPNGGCHIQQEYEFIDLFTGTNTKDALELVEWAPVNSQVTATTYPNYQAWCGLTNYPAPINVSTAATCVATAPQCGLVTGYYSNYTSSTFQQPGQVLPPTQGGIAGADRVQVNAAAAYVTGSAFTTFQAFPLFNPPFDYANAGGQASGTSPVTNLVFEQDIAPGNQKPNFIKYRSTNGTPVRRNLGSPVSTIGATAPFANGGSGYDVYQMRFTFVGRYSTVRSLFYDTGIAAPVYQSFNLSPNATPATVPPAAPNNGGQPAGTSSQFFIEVVGGTTQPTAGVVTSPALKVVDTDLPATALSPAALNTIVNRRFFRFRANFIANNLTNMVPSYSTVIMAYSF